MPISEFDILLIDDDEDDYIFLKDLFSDISASKYKITWKSSYRDGLNALHQQHFDACLLDYRLGEHTGIDLLREVRKLGFVCPIIFLTGQGDFDLDVQVMQIGASEYLVKDQLTPPLLERSIRYSMKHALDMEEVRESKAQILQQDRLASLGLLASSLAHEIGTPLGIIRSRAELVERRVEQTSSTQQDMRTIISQIDRITKLVNSLLHLAREKQSDKATLVDLSIVIQDVLNLTQHELDRHHIKMVQQIPPNVMVKAEQGPLGQVFLNLLVNSIHAIEEAKKRDLGDTHSIILRAQDSDSAVEISIQDSGCGIPERNLGHLFKPFFTTKDIGMGTGLGLATTYKLVQSWGGSIQVESTEGIGSTFKVKLNKA